ncbi:unnamed protein product, partial [Brenthis ino]
MDQKPVETRQLLNKVLPRDVLVEVEKGEKLYVTADKRGEKGGCKRPLCWTLLGLVVAAIVALIVLAATGILFGNSPTPLEQYNASVSSARAFGGITGDHSSHNHDHSGHNHDHSGHHHDHDHDHNEHDHDETTPSEYSADTQNDEAHGPLSEESDDTSMYVPRTVEGELKIDNEIFVPAMEDPDSEEYREFTSTFTDALKHALFDRNSMENGDNEIMIEVVQIRNGSVIVTYRIHWIPKHNTDTNEELLTAKSLKTNLDNYLNTNNRMISVYHVAEENIKARPVLDLCKVNNNDCEYKCEFDDSNLDFICTCPHGQIPDMHSPKKCISFLDEQNIHETSHKDASASTMRSVSEEDNSDTDDVQAKENEFDWKQKEHFVPDTTTETDHDLNFPHIFGHSSSEDPKPEPEPEPVQTSPVPQSSEEEPKPEPGAEPESTEVQPEPTAEPKPEPEPEPESESEPKPEPEPTIEPQPEPEPEPAAEPQPEPEPVPTAEPKPEPEPTSEPEPSSETKAEPEPIAEPKPEPEPTAEPKPEPTSEPEPTAEPKPNMESSSEVTPIQHPSMEYESRSKQGSIDAIPIISEQTTNNPEMQQTTITNSEHMPNSEEHQDEMTQVNTTPRRIFDHPTFDLDSLMGLHTTSESSQTISPENEIQRNIELEPQNEMPMTTTTMRISISEPGAINEPSYEPNPEIISILKENGEQAKSNDSDDDWLQVDDNNMNVIPSNADTTTVANENSNTQMQSESNDKSEQRSSKTFNDFLAEETTDKVNENKNDDITFDLIQKNNEMPSVETTTLMSEENTQVPVFIPSGPINIESKDNTNKKAMETTTMNVLMNKVSEQSQDESKLSQFVTENNVYDTQVNNENKVIINTDSQSPALNEKPELQTTTEVEQNMHSINEQNDDSDDEKKLVIALVHTTTPKPISEGMPEMEKDMSNENSDVTFDTINMLYNRSSKAIVNQENKIEDITVSNNNAEATTESDWLSESVTEVNYEDVAKKEEKIETTETSAAKIEEIMGTGMNKDDFEPDYLNNMETITKKMSDQSDVMYNMSQDYDSDDARVKRVNDQVENSDENGTNSIHDVSISSSKVNPVETTTVGQYIYKVAEKNVNEMTANTESSLPHPAPVWEEIEPERETPVTEQPKPEPEESRVNNNVNVVTPTTMPPTTVANMGEMEQINPSEMDAASQNTTQVSNLNVTIYEISSPNDNVSFITAKPAVQDFEDHETEMNPFLPEVENNKSLVKKLQEGHDINEPTNLNETQNENVEEHNNSDKVVMEAGQADKTNEPVAIQPEQVTTAPNTNDMFNQLYTNSNPQINSDSSTAVNKPVTFSPISDESQNTEANEKVIPISTFLLDTDDLDTTRRPTGIPKNELENTLSGEIVKSEGNNNEFLSVVPIEDVSKDIKKDYSGDNQELNFISDSPKKSDRRLDVSSLDTNEA